MSEAELSSEFEYSASFLRILIPGIIFTTLISILILFYYSNYIPVSKVSIEESIWTLLPVSIIFIVISMFVGLFINVLITPLTRVLEGYYLEQNKKDEIIGIFWNMFHLRQWEQFVNYRNEYNSAEMNSIERGAAYTNIYNFFSYCLSKMTSNPKIDDFELKKGILPTKFGNVFRSIEIYPEWKYGMNGIFYWTRIQMLMSEDNKKTVDKMYAFVDMFVELTWIFLFTAVIYSIVLAKNGNYIYSVIFLIIFLILSLLSYNLAVQSALKFGLYVRSIFDLYRYELWTILKMGIFNKLKTLPENERWKDVFRYLWFYNVNQCEKCGKFYEIPIEHKCK